MFVCTINRAARAAGMAPGMMLADARALLPSLATVAANPRADAALLDRIARWCERYTPWVGLHEQDGVWLNVTGCAHLFGGEHAMLDDLLKRLTKAGFCVRGAMADTPGAAWAVTRCGKSATVVPSNSTGETLAPLPVLALRLEPKTVATLNRLGLKRIGDLYPIPRVSLAARFREHVVRRLDQALGHISEPISPRPPLSAYNARIAFAEPIGRTEDIARALDHLLLKLCARLKQADRGCRRLELVLCRVDNTTQSTAIGTARPVREPRSLARLFEERLGTLDPGFGVEAMALSAPVTEIYTPSQHTTVSESVTTAGDDNLSTLVDQLGNRLGFETVLCFRVRESYVPERAFYTVSANDPAPGDWPQKSNAMAPARPLRLLNRPEAIRTITLLPPGDPADPPALFQWRRKTHRTRTALGPERIAPEWWRDNPAWQSGPRDYWQVEDENGTGFWIYLEAHASPETASRWFLHGLFS